MLVDTGRKNVGVNLADARNGVAGDIQEHIRSQNLDVAQGARLTLADERETFVLESFVAHVLASDQRVWPRGQISAAPARRRRPAADLRADIAETQCDPISRHLLMRSNCSEISRSRSAEILCCRRSDAARRVTLLSNPSASAAPTAAPTNRPGLT